MRHVLQHMALELQNMVGQKLGCAQLCLAADPGAELRPASQQIVFQYEQPDVGIAAGKIAIRLLESLLAPASDPELDFPSKLRELFELPDGYRVVLGNERVSAGRAKVS